MAQALEFTDANFESEVLKSDSPVLVDFWAPWCGPCKMIGPVIEELAGELEGKVKIGKLNVDNHQQTMRAYGVRSIPTLMIFKGGERVETLIGALPKDAILSKLEEHQSA